MLKKLINRLKRRAIRQQQQAARRVAARAVLSQSKLFDAQWYAERYPDVIAAGLDPLDHFVRHGAAEGRNPSDRFDLLWYLNANADVAETGINPLLHYLEHGRDEGRSIRAVSNARDDEDFDFLTGRPRRDAEADQPPVNPYPSDFTSVQQARPVRWRALSPYLTRKDAQTVVAIAEDKRGAADLLADFLQTAHPDTPESARIRLFQAMRRDACPRTNDSVAEYAHQAPFSQDGANQLLTAHGLGVEAIVDGWFAHSTQLLLRAHRPGTGATRLRAFQYTVAGTVACCADADVADGEIQLVRVALEHQLCPILLTWQSSDGALTACALVPFPSLFRGGLHYAEIAAEEAISGKRPAIGDHMAMLALQAYCWRNPDEGFAIKRIAVSLAGANGSEAIFGKQNIAVLAAQFGIELEPRWSGDEDAVRRLGETLRAEVRGPRVAERAKDGFTLVLPADCFPSLASLAARSGAAQLGLSSFCVVDAATRELDTLVCQPGAAAKLAKLYHPALPLPVPIIEDDASGLPMTGSHFGAPIMIRLRDAKVWNVDALMPLSPDTTMPHIDLRPSAANEPRRRITVILEQSANDNNFFLCLRSLAQQTIADDLSIILLGDGSLQSIATELFGEQQVALSAASGVSPAERINKAAASVPSGCLLLLDSTVCLPDPRTLAVLLEMVCQPHVASASCTLVEEDDADGSTSVAWAGYIEHWPTSQTIPETVARQSDFARLFPASTYRVMANDTRLCLIPIAIWRDLGGLNATNFPDSYVDMDFGLRAGAANLEHYCTSLIRASVARQASVLAKPGRAMLPAIPQELCEKMSEQVSRMRELR